MLFSNAVEARDLGVVGQVFNIKEQDLLEVIKTKLGAMQAEGSLMAEQQKIVNKTLDAAQNPIGIDLPLCKKTHEFNYDPGFYWPTDLKDHNGRTFYKAFTKVNPFDSIPPTHRIWILFDGTDLKQLDWIKDQPNSSKLILVKGSPIKLMQELKIPIYFDSQSRITKKLSIKSLPAIVKLENKQITITEVGLGA
jgi:conjugal transfer pilus assembly protein TraW